MKVSKNKFVSVIYELYVGDDDDKRELMESPTVENPLQFLFGTDTMLPAFEENIKGLEAGSEFKFTLTPENAFGEYSEEKIYELPKSIFEENGKFNDERIKEGVTVPMMMPNGEQTYGSVLEIQENVVVMDFNNPFAGETLHFSGKILDVHEPTIEEIVAINQAMKVGCGCGCDCEECGDEHGCDGGNQGFSEGGGCGCGCEH